MRRFLVGRELLEEEIPDELKVENWQEGLTKRSGWLNKSGRFYCRRCGSRVNVMTPSFCNCGEECGYCRNCLQMGRVKKCSILYSLPMTEEIPATKLHSMTWEGQLSEQQQMASRAIVETVKSGGKRLLYAVAGAGKTEMLFEGIYTALNLGKLVCVASPRIDVCLELAPRLQEAFATTGLAVLYGDSQEPYRFTPLVIATTHQLLRFYRAFDVLIIDEVDAFPYHNNDVLNFGAKKCVQEHHSLIYLTATPSQKVKKAFKKDEILILPARYHGYPLPEPQAIWSGEWQESLLKKSAYPHKVIKQIEKWLQNNRTFLIFCPNIQWMKKFEERLHQIFPKAPFTSVSSEDERRKEKVLNMRERKYRFMLTTTILERGVTFPNIDIMVIGAEDPLFDEPALIQIAGRAGRSFKYPTGEVIFYHEGRTRAINSAIFRIRQLNRTAKKRGLLND